MAAPTSNNEVTARRLTRLLTGSDGNGGLWGKIKDKLAGKQDTLAAQTAYTSKGTATKVPQITTNSLGQVTGITEVTITGVTPASHTHGNIANGGTLTDTAAAASGNDYVVIRDADNAKIQTSTIKGTDVADAVSKKHSHSTLTLSTTAQAYDGSHTLALPSTDPYTSARTPASHTHGNITNGGALQTTDVTIASGDKLVVTDASDSNKVARASIAFDGSTTGQLLSKAGTFQNPKEAYLEWGGKNFAGGYGPLDAALVSELGANRFAYGKPAGIAIEYTRDGGTTWQDYGATDAQKIAFFTISQQFVIGKADSTNKATAAENWEKYKLRITLSFPGFGLDCRLCKFAMLVARNGTVNPKVTLRAMTRTEEEGAATTWSTRGTTTLAGWSGWNILNTTLTETWSGASSQKGNYSKWEFLFEAGSASSGSDLNYSGLIVYCIYAYGASPAWTAPSDLAKTGHLYSYDASKNATFPAKVTATEFNGTATTARNYDTSTGTIKTTFDNKTDFASVTDTTIDSNTTAASVQSYFNNNVTALRAKVVYKQYSNENLLLFGKGSVNYGVVVKAGYDSRYLYLMRKSKGTWVGGEAWEKVSAGYADTAGSASKLGTSNLGSTTKPIYLAAGVATECSAYAGGTAVTLNGTSAAASTASFYAPTGAGTSGQILTSAGTGAPTWSTANAALVGITVTSSSVSDGTNTFNKYVHPTTAGNKHVPSGGATGNILGWDSAGTAKWISPSASTVGITVTSTSVSDGTNTFNKYTHPTTSGNKHVPSGGSSGQFLGWSADGTAAWVANPNTDTKVTSAANHYTPETASGSDKTASASGATAAWSIDVVKGVTLNTDGKGHVTGVSVTSGKIPANPNTDTKVTSSANHYTPATASGSDVTASATGATAAWSIDVVKGVTLNTDGKGHVTGLSVTSGKIPGNPNTDTKQNVTLATTSKAFITGVTTTPTSSAQALTGVADTGVYLTTNAGELNATKYKINEACTMQYNSSTLSVDFVF